MDREVGEMSRPETDAKKRGKNTRRFSSEQVRSLEAIFESETKLQPRKKVQVARELGLQPKQVAVWFQNKRARWKSKEIEKKLRAMKANYDNLIAHFETLKKQKESLLEELQELKSVLNEKDEESKGRNELDEKCLETMGKENEEDAQLANTDEFIDVSLQAILYEQSLNVPQWWESWNWFSTAKSGS